MNGGLAEFIRCTASILETDMSCAEPREQFRPPLERLGGLHSISRGPNDVLVYLAAVTARTKSGNYFAAHSLEPGVEGGFDRRSVFRQRIQR